MSSESSLASMFGFVTDEDRARWEQRRQANAKNVSGVRQAVSSGLGSLVHALERNVTSELRAAHQVAAQEQFEESNVKTTTKRWDSRKQSIVETVDYSPKDDERHMDEPDLER